MFSKGRKPGEGIGWGVNRLESEGEEVIVGVSMGRKAGKRIDWGGNRLGSRSDWEEMDKGEKLLGLAWGDGI